MIDYTNLSRDYINALREYKNAKNPSQEQRVKIIVIANKIKEMEKSVGVKYCNNY